MKFKNTLKGFLRNTFDKVVRERSRRGVKIAKSSSLKDLWEEIFSFSREKEIRGGVLNLPSM